MIMIHGLDAPTLMASLDPEHFDLVAATPGK